MLTDATPARSAGGTSGSRTPCDACDRESELRATTSPIRWVTVVGFAVLALVTSCGDDSQLNVQSPPAVSTAATSESTVSPATTEPSPSSGCPVPPSDVAPQRGDCTLVDWDAVRVDGSHIELQYYVNEPGCSLALSRVDIDERNDEVSLRVVGGVTGDEGASCPTAYAWRATTVELAAPLGARRLLGCRPEGSFVPKGGYNTPEPRDASKDCSPLR
jgi:hypothetical protein